MSGIVLSASVRQNLLSLQSTASLLATTQNDLATGKKVNSALDNPTNFFTAQGLDNRASDIGNLLDSIGNGVQVLQAANTGITSLQKLVDSAKSIANQVLQTPTGYSTLASATATVGAVGTATDLTSGGTTTLQGKTVTFTPATGPALTLTFSNVIGAGNVNSLAALNSAIAAAGIGIVGSISSTGFLTFTSSNDAASEPDHHHNRRCGTEHRFNHGNHGSCGSGCSGRRYRLANNSRQPCRAIQQHHCAGHHDFAGFLLQRRQPVERRHPQADLRRNRQIHAQHHRRHL